jgi:hypothetical protein
MWHVESGLIGCVYSFLIQEDRVFPFVSYMIYYPLVLGMLVFNCFADASPLFSEYPPIEVSEKID